MKFIGLTGGICCGKTEVAEMFITLDARVIDADRISRELTKPYKPAWKEIVKSFGREFLLPDENLDRKKIAGEVFKNKKKLQLLNKIMHQRILAQIEREVKKERKEKPDSLIIVDAPLLIELGYNRFAEKVIVVSADRKTQIERMIKRDKISKEEALLRLKSQMPVSEKIRFADYLVDNSGSKAMTFKTVKKIFSELSSLFEAPCSKL
ncbi:MAG: dephospho-CoA kinase [Candidatus Schekmanbacteria bacterium RIFCSPLOWO2_02_FULL_38_14]|uniref:Dephospho-CoA kinase n=1 Tax=Candidatus Schekmanbacteria bacterium RIFCSPLOWO2_12_FULL_38_15 TaxID=1817883 RepID=A0A1F7SDQ3_9BACT|nr:MAG: dephospho-CoA kinase [Candidatus Schekmanbacteria bacterium RIFCSPLOWO2_02_FULL_38_14]OGL51851.1 MAG: dephospho-CoA kinase [Candidatus Schekmanbacteria bacterium RIFCSPLOWO2_12_FULL_38_15]